MENTCLFVVVHCFPCLPSIPNDFYSHLNAHFGHFCTRKGAGEVPDRWVGAGKIARSSVTIDGEHPVRL